MSTEGPLYFMAMLAIVGARVYFTFLRQQHPRVKVRGLQAYAASQDYVYRRDGPGDEVLEIERRGIAISARRILEPGIGVEPTAHWSVHATIPAVVRGALTLRKRKDDDGPTIRLGHVDFDTRFHLETALKRREVRKLFDEAVVTAVATFGVKIDLSYEDGALWIEWSDLDARSREDLERALDIVAALGRERIAALPYRDGGEAPPDD
jgi:hypothetical protein